MCFITDYDWRASAWEEADGPAPAATRCDECGERIHAGEWRRHVSARECEECRRCEDECSDWYEEDHPDCAGGEHDYGETMDYDCCRRCQTLRDALRAAEEADGCTGEEAEPGLGSMYAEVGDAGGWGNYADEFLRLGLFEAFALVPAPAADDVFEGLAREYPGAACHTAGGPADPWRDIGGEGG